MRAPLKARTPEELATLLSAVAIAILAGIIIATLYFGREIFVPIALAILLSFVLAPLVSLLQRMRVPPPRACRGRRRDPGVCAHLRDGQSAGHTAYPACWRSSSLSDHHR